MKMYYVIGGVYTDTSFTQVIGEEERYGPFKKYQDAEDEWRSRSWLGVDNCHCRYTIVKENEHV